MSEILVYVAASDGSRQPCRLIYIARGQEVALTASIPFAGEQQFIGQNLFDALNKLRLRLEDAGYLLLCNAARRDTYPSRAVRQMGGGFKVYVLHSGQQAKLSDLVDALAPAEAGDVVSVAEQRATYEQWLRSLG
ncbi:hypothetical protein [Paraburkholderia metrosideri]|uniref:hypothetical protein n=1 Tax=Paraburkholderia metrosideri TaxID=580937 RepID=UPI00191AABF6|nr:hypothetical protein [Paraburkholderia metrosideri]